MTLLSGDTGRISVGTLKTFNFTYPTPKEDNDSLNLGYGTFTTSLPTTQNANIGATFTVQSSDLPIIDGNPTTKYTAFIIVSGVNNSGATATVSTQPFKNGLSVNSSTTLSNITTTNKYWQVTWYKFFDVVVGDVLNIQTWASVTNVSLDYCAMIILPTQTVLTKKGTFLKDFSVTSTSVTLSQQPASGGTLSQGTNTQIQFYPSGGAVIFQLGSGTNSGFGFMSGKDYIYILNSGDQSQNLTQSVNSTLRQYHRQYTPSVISFREISL